MGWLTEIRLRRGNVERRPKHHPIPAGARGLPWPLAPSGIGESGVDDKKGSLGPPPAGLPASLVRPCLWVTSPAPSLW